MSEELFYKALKGYTVHDMEWLIKNWYIHYTTDRGKWAIYNVLRNFSFEDIELNKHNVIYVYGNEFRIGFDY